MFRICCTFKRRDLISPDPGSHFRQPTSPEDLSCAILGQEEMIIQIQNAKTGIQMQRPAVKLETDLKICKSPTFGKTYIGIFEPRSGMEITNTHLPTTFVKIGRRTKMLIGCSLQCCHTPGVVDTQIVT